MAEHTGRVKLLILIDGLDEFAIPPKETVEVISSISQQAGGRVKICVACRPWYEFKDYFIRFPSLTMHLLTHKDLQLYISDKFNASPAFHERRAEADSLQAAVMARSDGVFLWVSVVTNFLIESLQRGDTEAELKIVVQDLPSKMSQLYDNIWERVPQSFRDAASRIFLLLEASFEKRLLFLELWVIDEQYGRPALETSPEITLNMLERVRQTISRRLQSRTHGLLEILPNHTIGYLHRTAYEWRMQQMLASQHEQHFRPHSTLLEAFLVLGRWYPYSKSDKNPAGISCLDQIVWPHESENWKQHIVNGVLYHAARVSVDPNLTPEETTNLGAGLEVFSEISDHWIELGAGPTFPSWTTKLSTQRDVLAPRFVDVAACLGLTPLFTRAFMERKQRVLPTQLLRHAIFPPEYQAVHRLVPKASDLESRNSYLQCRASYLTSGLFSPANRLEIIRSCLTPIPVNLASSTLRDLRGDVEDFAQYNLDIDAKTDEVLLSYFRQVTEVLGETQARIPKEKGKTALKRLVRLFRKEISN